MSVDFVQYKEFLRKLSKLADEFEDNNFQVMNKLGVIVYIAGIDGIYEWNGSKLVFRSNLEVKLKKAELDVNQCQFEHDLKKGE